MGVPRGVYQLPMIVKTPTANGASRKPITIRSAKTSRTFCTAAKQNVTIDQSNSQVGSQYDGRTGNYIRQNYFHLLK